MGLQESISVDLHLIKSASLLNVPPGTEAHLEIISGTTSGKNIAATGLSNYLTIAPSSVMVGEK